MRTEPVPAVVTETASLMAALTLEEKVSLLAGEDMWHLPSVERLGIPRLKMTDGPVGARGAHLSGGPPSACFPCGTALAATWDPDLVDRVGVELGNEARAKGAQVLLAPTVNIHRHPLAGRNFECFSEDPHLTGRMAGAYIRGVQSTGVASCIKHFVCNDSEFERFTISSEVPDRALREVYLRPFEMAIASADPWAVMGAYNKLAGTWCCENPQLLTGILRDEWGYKGVVISDWFATHTTSEALRAGLDIEMPGPAAHRGERLLEALEEGSVDPADVDRAVARILVAMDRTSLFATGGSPEGAEDTPERRRVALEAARSAIVLLRNDPVGGQPLLPLQAGRSVAVIGPCADGVTILGGGSAVVAPYRIVTPLSGLVDRLAGGVVGYEPGCAISRKPAHLDPRWVTAPGGENGLQVAIRASTGEQTQLHLRMPVLVREAVPPDGDWSARWTATLTVPISGRYLVQLCGSGSYSLSLDGHPRLEGSVEEVTGRIETVLDLVSGPSYDLVIDQSGPPTGTIFGSTTIRCGLLLDDAWFDRAVTLAARADVAVVVVGNNDDTETEGKDRPSMDLPGRQAELVRAVAAVNPRTVVVINAGSPVNMDWEAQVPAVLQAWFLGQEAGEALAGVLCGDVDASGRLPTTIPRCVEDTPAFTNYPGENGAVNYSEGVFVGYRWYDSHGIAPRYPFGHGLSYTTFEYGRATARTGPDGTAVTIEVTNTGHRPGSTVLQAYVSALDPSVVRPAKELKGFTKVHLGAGDAAEATIDLEESPFAYWDTDRHGWRTDAGRYEVLVGVSAGEIVARCELLVAALKG